VVQELPIPPGFFAATGRDVNDPGDVVGYAGSPQIDAHAVLWRNGVAIDLGVWPGGHYSVANRVNNLGQIVGTGTVAGDNLDHALLWTVSDGANTTPTAILKPTSRTIIRVGGSVSVKAGFSDRDNGPWNFDIDWGDGHTTSGSVASPGIIPGITPHAYNVAGSFRAVLSVTDAEGATGSSAEIRVRVR
jgi:probable HAF family extracellular repeat protein